MSAGVCRSGTGSAMGWVRILAAVLAAAAGSAGPAAAQRPEPVGGFSAAAAARELGVEAQLAGMLDADSTGVAFRYLTAEPHPAGSVRNQALADWMADRFRAYGWDEVRLHRYDVYLPWPEHVRVTMTAPTQFEATLREDGYAADPDSWAPVGPTYLGMSASGDVTGQLVYANSGNPADYDWLQARGIDLQGKIAIVRYSNPYSYRGFKALTAQRYGLKAVLIYSDPAEDGYRQGLTFPDGPWGPASHIQRGSITYDFLAAGDPLTPGWASVEGARRIAPSEALSVPSVIAVPLSARDATPMLEALGGPVAPPAWQGALPFTYRVGPGATTVHVDVKMDDSTRSIWVVEARLRGTEHPDELVVLGNHRDAWVYGAVDPSSGTATELELARTLGRLARDGHRPRRTIVLGSWDAEEWHLTGSTEWGEELAPELDRQAVAYLNVDGSTSGSAFLASAVASLNPLIREVTRDVIDPNSRKSLLEAWRTSAGATNDSSLVANRLGSGSDYTVFLNRLGIPVADLAFDGPYGVYHSVYDDYYWMTHFGDPGFRYMTAMAEVWGRMALRLANAEILPYDYSGYAVRVGRFVDQLAALPEVTSHLDLAPARAGLARWRAAAARADALRNRLLSSSTPDPVRVGRMNDALRVVERQWLLPDGLPGRPWFRHALYAPRPTYAAMELPGVREAVEAGDWARAGRELAALTARIEAVAEAVDAAVESR